MKRLALPLATALLVAACVDAGTAATTTSAPLTTGADRREVVIDSFAFTPAEITVPVGATVTWVNRHVADHNVVADDGTFASPLFGRGESYSFTFTEPGEYPYICSIHPAMRGTIIVVPSWGPRGTVAWAVTPASGAHGGRLCDLGPRAAATSRRGRVVSGQPLAAQRLRSRSTGRSRVPGSGRRRAPRSPGPGRSLPLPPMGPPPSGRRRPPPEP